MSSKTKANATAPKKEAAPPRVPKRRFPEFRKASLLSALLGDVTKESRSRNGNKHSLASVMGVTKADGIVPMEARLIAADIARYKLVEHDWFAYNPMRLNIGSIARWKGEREILVSPDYVVFRCIAEGQLGIAPGYLDQFRQTKAWEEFVTEGGDGSVRVRIYYDDVARIKLALPSLPEQQKIAECLSSVDELIAAQARKLDALKTHKKGLMQQLFPREGETRPVLRFPRFRNAGEWVEDKLIDIATFRRGSFPQPYGLPEWYDEHGGMPFVQVFDVGDNFRLKDKTKSKISKLGAEKSVFIPQGTLIVTLQGSIGRVAITHYDAYIDRTLLIFESFLKPIEKVFFARLIQNLFDIEKEIAPGGIIKTITKEALSDFAVKLPTIEEQQCIADCFTALDDLIAAQTQTLEALKTHKQGLMQQLFPAPEEVEA